MDLPNMVYGLSLPVLMTGVLTVLIHSGMPRKLTPLTSLLLGIALAFLFRSTLEMQLEQTILLGIYWGLTPVGLHSGSKSVMEYIKNCSGE